MRLWYDVHIVAAFRNLRRVQNETQVLKVTASRFYNFWQMCGFNAKSQSLVSRL